MSCINCRSADPSRFSITTAFQPIVDCTTGDVLAYEALVRGVDGRGADAVLAAVSDNDLYAFDQACRVTAIRTAVAAGILATNARLSINFLPNAVYSPVACIQLTLATAREVGFPPDRLIFEFTENQKLAPAHIQSIVRTYRKMGFATAIDDFGAGHAGLNLLADLGTDFIKLDMKLVRGIDSDKRRRLIVETMVELCRKLEVRLIGEGVETAGELATLRGLGIDLIQGYLLARPAVAQLPSYSSPMAIAAAA